MKRFHGNTKVICDHKETDHCPLKAKNPKQRVKSCKHSKPHKPSDLCQCDTFLCTIPNTVSPIDGQEEVMSCQCVRLAEKDELKKTFKQWARESIIEARKNDLEEIRRRAKRQKLTNIVEIAEEELKAIE